jgi:putative ABC transport system substrate-binding protein
MSENHPALTPSASNAHDFGLHRCLPKQRLGEADIDARRRFLGLALLALAGAAARAQPPPGLARIAVLTGPGDLAFRDTFANALRDLGWVEGRNLVLDWRPTSRREDVPALAADMVRQRPHVVIICGPQLTLAMAHATSDIPIVFIAVGDPVQLGVVRSLTHPGGNVTGFQTTPNQGLAGKLLQLLKEAAPRTTRVGFLVTSTNTLHANFVERGTAFAKSLGLSVVVLDVKDKRDFEPAFELARREGVNGLATPGDLLFSANRERIAALALQYRLPSVFMFSYYAEAGGLLAYAVSVPSFLRSAARQADKILRGAHPREMPVEMAETYDFVINLKTAKQLGLKIPDSLRIQATQVIE